MSSSKLIAARFTEDRAFMAARNVAEPELVALEAGYYAGFSECAVAVAECLLSGGNVSVLCDKITRETVEFCQRKLVEKGAR